MGVVGLPLPPDAATETTLATRASEATLAALLAAFGLEDFASETSLAALLAAFSAEDFATEATLATLASEATVAGLLTDTQLRAAAVPVSGPLTDAEIRATALPVSAAALPLPAGAATEVTLATRATEVTLATRASEATLASLLTAFGLEDFASETSLAALLAAFSAEDFASETTLATRASEATLATRASEVTLAALLTAFGLEDFSSETTLAALLAAFSAEDFASETTLASLEAKDFATQTTLAALLSAFSAEDFATQATLEAVRVLLASLDAKDFATQTTLAAILVDTGQIETLLTAIDADTSNLDVLLSTRATSANQTNGSQVAQAVGNVAHDAADSGDPVKVGGVATAAPPSAVTEGDRVDSSFDLLGRLRIIDKPEIPAGSVAVKTQVQGNVAGTTAIDTDYVVPDGDTLTITKLLAGGEAGSRESKFELYHSTDAGVSDGTLLEFGYIGDGGQDVKREPNFTVTGSGVNVVIRMRRERLDANTRELAASWEGHQTT